MNLEFGQADKNEASKKKHYHCIIGKQTSSNTNTNAETTKQSQPQLCLMEHNPDLLHGLTACLERTKKRQRK